MMKRYDSLPYKIGIIPPASGDIIISNVYVELNTYPHSTCSPQLELSGFDANNRLKVS
jgi:hypothetical protein